MEWLLGSVKEDLLRKLNLSSAPQEQVHVRPPDFMVQLYNTYAADQSSTPRADVIRSFSVQDVSLSESRGGVSRHRFLFNISVPASERVGTVQLRLYTQTGPRAHACSSGTTAATIRVYQLENHTEPHRLRGNTREPEHGTETEQTEEIGDREETEEPRGENTDRGNGEPLKGEKHTEPHGTTQTEPHGTTQIVDTDQTEPHGTTQTVDTDHTEGLLPVERSEEPRLALTENDLRIRGDLGGDGTQTAQSSYHFLDEREVAWSRGSWEMFDVTAALRSGAGSGRGVAEFEVRVQRAPCGGGAEMADVSGSLTGNTSAVLIVFSSDQRGRRREAQQELQHTLSHEDEAVFSGAHEPRDASDDPNDLHAPQYTPHTTPAHDLHIPPGQPQLPQNVLPDGWERSSPVDARRTRRRRHAASGYCRRTSLRVNFKDIGWHEWIVAPPEYEAYECKGTCQFPLSPDVTPSKHAIIQSLVNLRHPGKANMACCVPTKLDPITIMYQENGVITVRHLYEEMRVAACGCR
ncbi:growth/differentiation factor 2 [Alosa sapidissima]|uniref:growth/differentiation factor 2 n=1 Tax=Alosa sapidissima TaxID=34773 RepID=UPI001C088B2D|nr:growth/differentiation factor 2 [Alosa sapidissima]